MGAHQSPDTPQLTQSTLGQGAVTCVYSIVKGNNVLYNACCYLATYADPDWSAPLIHAPDYKPSDACLPWCKVTSDDTKHYLLEITAIIVEFQGATIAHRMAEERSSRKVVAIIFRLEHDVSTERRRDS